MNTISEIKEVNELRTLSLNLFNKHGYPTKKDEDWKQSTLNYFLESNKNLEIYKPNKEVINEKVLEKFKHNKIFIVNGLVQKTEFEGKDKEKLIITSIDEYYNKNNKHLSKCSQKKITPYTTSKMKIIISEKQYKLIFGDNQLDEQGDDPAAAQPSSGVGSSGSKQGYPEVGKWESGVTRGPANQVGVTKWSDVVGESYLSITSAKSMFSTTVIFKKCSTHSGLDNLSLNVRYFDLYLPFKSMNELVSGLLPLNTCVRT